MGGTRCGPPPPPSLSYTTTALYLTPSRKPVRSEVREEVENEDSDVAAERDYYVVCHAATSSRTVSLKCSIRF
ncbi:hypothetical protein EVAR_99642_1 [Eumeta japonica]|uniref:Uncharacterized protein n=1 Tax=Eumeta variegata TaxID=151549 RepID=A0A4C1ZSA2_EUMVA|nr:hypothetical protein EVAR_99642_1 [Eumeta japonica]